MASTHTNETVFATAGIETANLEFPELEIPVLTGIQRQGDLIVVPTTMDHRGVPLTDGVTVVEAESAAGNAHILIGEGSWTRNHYDDLIQGVVSVPPDGEAFLIHTEEHNALGIGPGTYEIRRQREWDPTAGVAEFEARQRAEDRAEQAERLRIREELVAYRRVRD